MYVAASAHVFRRNARTVGAALDYRHPGRNLEALTSTTSAVFDNFVCEVLHQLAAAGMALTRDQLFKKLKSKPENKVRCRHIQHDRDSETYLCARSVCLRVILDCGYRLPGAAHLTSCHISHIVSYNIKIQVAYMLSASMGRLVIFLESH